jgi:voltage-gated potassium channel
MAEVDHVHALEQTLSRKQVHRLLRRALLRSVVAAVVLVGLYYVAPLTSLEGVPVIISLSVGLVIFSAVVAWQLRAIIHAPYPGVRAVEGLAFTVPLFIVTYATAYFVMAQDNPANFSTPSLTRTDALYFTVTVLATVGFGDITATSQTARVLVMTQMLLDLVILGLGVHLLLHAVNLGRKRQTESGTQPAEGDMPRPNDASEP